MGALFATTFGGASAFSRQIAREVAPGGIDGSDKGDLVPPSIGLDFFLSGDRASCVRRARVRSRLVEGVAACEAGERSCAMVRDAAWESVRGAGEERGVVAVGQDVDEALALRGQEIASSLRSSQ